MCFLCRKKPKSAIGIVNLCKRDPIKILNWIYSNIWYVSDDDNHEIKEYWQTTKETLTGEYNDGSKGKPYSGDCEDSCIIARDCFNIIGIDSYILAVGTPSDWAGDIPIKYKGHAVLAYEMNGRWYHFSNWGIKHTQATCLEEVAKYVYNKPGYWKLVESIVDGKPNYGKTNVIGW